MVDLSFDSMDEILKGQMNQKFEIFFIHLNVKKTTIKQNNSKIFLPEPVRKDFRRLPENVS